MEQKRRKGRKKQEKLVLFPEVYTNAVKMTDAQFGVLMRAVFEYRFEGRIYEGDDLAVDVSFRTVAGQIDRYAEICETNSNNAKGEEEDGVTETSEIQGNDAESPKGRQNAPPSPNPIPNPSPNSSKGNTADKPPTSTSFDFQAVQELYNCCCPSLPRCTKLTEKRKRAIQSCIKEKFTMEDFEVAFKKADASSFLTGKKTGSTFRAGFDWVVNPSNLAKVLEGNYDDMEEKHNGKIESKPLWTVGTTV